MTAAGLNVITGVSRSGTSMLAAAAREAVGAANFIGDAFPADAPHQPNPGGYWEHPITFRGYRKPVTDDDAGKWAKIVIRGLLNTDARKLGRIVLALRDPRTSAASRAAAGFAQAAMRRPGYYRRMIAHLGDWLQKNGKTAEPVEYNSIIDRPETLADLGFSPAVVRPELRRSAPVDDGQDWAPDLEAYRLAAAADWPALAAICRSEYRQPRRLQPSRLLPAAERDARRAVCHACDRMQNKRCTACSLGACRLSRMIATRAAQCPLGRWPQTKEPTP